MLKRRIQSIILNSIIFILISSATQIQINCSKDNYIHLVDIDGQKIPFKIKENPVFELRNNQLNIAVTSNTNSVFQVVGINEASLKDTVLKGNAFRLVYIPSENKTTFMSNETLANSILIIKCHSTKAGGNIIITLKGKIYSDEKFYRVEAQFKGKIPEKKYTSTDYIH